MRKFKPSRKAAREFAAKMAEIEAFCRENGIDASASRDSFYFTVNNQKYRVSNHSVEASNAGAYDEIRGKIRDTYHDGRKADVIYIHASKTRIIEIYENLKNGVELDGRGYRKVG